LENALIGEGGGALRLYTKANGAIQKEEDKQTDCESDFHVTISLVTSYESGFLAITILTSDTMDISMAEAQIQVKTPTNRQIFNL
jgi:hypothetical protein